MSISLSLLHPTLPPDSTLSCHLRTRGPQIAAPAAAAIAGGEGIKMCNLSPPRSLLSFSVSMLCLADVYPGPELTALSGLGFPPISLSLKPSSFCKTTQGRHTESVGLCRFFLKLCMLHQKREKL